MHEYGIAQEMLKVAFEYAEKHHASRITQFDIEMSATADESQDSLRFYFEELTRGTIAQGARVEIVIIPVRAKCLDCGNEFDWQVQDAAACPQCSGARLSVSRADDFRLVSISVD
jgi:hydrogenase nickel incorporation protein HypA/HybF